MKNEVILQSVSKSYDRIQAVRDVSLNIGGNEFFSILGPSGCGKTTLLRLVAGLESPDSGVISIGDRVVNNLPPHKREVGLVFQGTALFPHMNVFENIAFGLRMRSYPKGEIRERVMEVLRMMNMPPEIFAHKRVDQLSGGERQRVEIARSLVFEPRVLLLDEPLGPLDLKIRQKMQQELKRIQRMVGTTFIYVTHDQTEALIMSDRIAVMNRGEVLQVGTPEEIYSSPANKFVADFIGESNLIEGEVGEDGLFHIDGLPPIMVSDMDKNSGVRGRAFLCIRPEKISIYAEAEHDNSVSGIVLDKSYVGTHVVYRVEVGDRYVFTVYSNTSSRSFRLGERISLGWRSSDGVLVKG
ncbi:Spermidine/putrescine import ATP-binding protein PotA [archaeon HR01]|nr:Spermidine/putrescine import ATP-binding protein PotA [archaeon HR01]